MSLLEAKAQVCQFLVAWYPADLEEFPAAAPEKSASIDVLISDLRGEADCDMPEFTGDSDIGCRSTIHCNYERLCKACSRTEESVPSSVAYFLSLAISTEEAMRRASILKVRVGALETKW